MPELPEVETIRNDLRKKILGKKITQVVIELPRVIKGDKNKFKKILLNNNFKEIDRVGKLLIFLLGAEEKYLLVHLKMTGQLIYCAKNYTVAGGHSLPKLEGGLPNKYSRVILYFQDKSTLFFNDQRTFGYLKIVAGEELKKVKAKFGLDPLARELNHKNLSQILSNRKSSVKALIMNQELIAGIGNIYADEILFSAGVRPDRAGSSLKKEEIKKIAVTIKRVLLQAIKYRGTTFNDYVDADGNQGGFVKRLKVYGRKGEKCPRCGGTVVKKKIAGRGTHFCPQCQK